MNFLSAIPDDSTKDLIDRLVQDLSAHHDAILRMFKKMDTGYDGKIGRAEVRRGLLQFPISLNASEVDTVLRSFDTNFTGYIKYVELNHVIVNHHPIERTRSKSFTGVVPVGKEPRTPPKKRVIEADFMQRFLDRMNDRTTRMVLDRLVLELQSRHEAVYELLARMDRNGDGQLSRSEITEGLLGMRIALTSSELESVIRAFDRDGKGAIDYLEFYHVLKNHQVQRMIERDTRPMFDDEMDSRRVREMREDYEMRIAQLNMQLTTQADDLNRQ